MQQIHDTSLQAIAYMDAFEDVEKKTRLLFTIVDDKTPTDKEDN